MYRIIVLISFLCSSTLIMAQRVVNIDSKGTKLITGITVTESAVAPSNPSPIQGDVWYDTATGITKTYDGSSWKNIDPDNVTQAATQPVGPNVEGDFWIDTTNDILNIFDDGTWKTVASTNFANHEPWYGDDDNAGATTNTEDIYHMGQVGLNVTDPTQRLDVNGAGLFRNGNGTSGTKNQILFGHNNTTNYKNAIRSRHGSINDFNNAIDFFTWDHGTNAIGDDPSLHGMTVTGGRVGISESIPTTFLHIKNTNALDATVEHNVNPILRLQRLGTTGSKFSQNAEFRIGTFDDILSARTRLDICLGNGNTNYIDRTPMTIRADGRVGINDRHNPEYNLDVNGSFRSTTSGLFTVMGGSDHDVNDILAGGNPRRGIRMWRWNDTNWGIYMSRPGATRSLSSGTAVDGGNFTAHAIRFRVHSGTGNGFIFENSNEELLFSIKGSDGRIRSADLDNQISDNGFARRTVVVEANGNLMVDNSRGTYYSAAGSWVSTTERELMPVGRWATIGGRMQGTSCASGVYSTTFKLEYNIDSGFSLIENYGPHNITWTFSGSGTTADPYQALSSGLTVCGSNSPRCVITAKEGKMYIRFTKAYAKAYNFVIETIG